MPRRGPTLAELVLSDDERATLERWARRPKSEQSLALWCKIVLARAEGLSNGEVAQRLGVHLATVGKCRKRFVERRLEGLHDEPRPGVPREFGDDDIEALVVKALTEEPKEATEAHLYSELCNLANLDHVFEGNTADVSTLPGVMEDLKSRFSVGRIALVADRGLISGDNLALLAAHGFDHVTATRLHHDDDVRAVLELANTPSSSWEAVPEARSFCAEVTHDSRRFIVVFSPVRYFRDRYRHLALCARIEDGLIAVEERVRAGRLVEPAKIGAAADRVLSSSPVGRCFVVTIRKGFFSWDFDQEAHRYDEEHLCGRLVITTSLTASQASAAQVLSYYRSLQNLERRFLVMKDFSSLRPMFHWTEARVRGHVALCVLAATIEAVMAQDLVKAKLTDPDLPLRSMTPRRALALLRDVRLQHISAGNKQIKLVNRRNALQAKVLRALDVDTSTWSKAEIA
ncbi:MAG: helix-turn-helix domain-containing protein [Acidimicrobiales bacterium]